MTNELAKLPSCPTCGTPMRLREKMSEEALFCGTWYDCPEYGCACSVLLPSKELREANDD